MKISKLAAIPLLALTLLGGTGVHAAWAEDLADSGECTRTVEKSTTTIVTKPDGTTTTTTVTEKTTTTFPC